MAVFYNCDGSSSVAAPPPSLRNVLSDGPISSGGPSSIASLAASLIPEGVRITSSVDVGMGSRDGDVNSFASASFTLGVDSLTLGASTSVGVSGRILDLESAYSGSGDNTSVLGSIHALTTASIMQLTDRYAGRLYMDATSASGLSASGIAGFLRVPPAVRALIILEDFSRRGQEYANKLAEDKAKEAAAEKSTSSAATGGDGEDPEEEAKYADNPKNPGDASFKPIGSKGARENLEDGSIWEKDTSSHGGEQWKRWPNKRSWEKGEKPNSIWPDGRVRK